MSFIWVTHKALNNNFFFFVWDVYVHIYVSKNHFESPFLDQVCVFFFGCLCGVSYGAEKYVSQKRQFFKAALKRLQSPPLCVPTTKQPLHQSLGTPGLGFRTPVLFEGEASGGFGGRGRWGGGAAGERRGRVREGGWVWWEGAAGDKS